jgi:predicted nucleotidyltransferase
MINKNLVLKYLSENKSYFKKELEKHFGRKVDIIVNGTVLPAFQDKVLNEII